MLRVDTQLVFDYLKSVLPHGSGIDCSWTFNKQKNGVITASNSYHCMDDNGFYCGYADFTVKFGSVYNPASSFSLHFNGKQAQTLNARHLLREYLEDTIYYAVKTDKALINDTIAWHKGE